MSAASKLNRAVMLPGEEGSRQFEISDERSAADVETMIRQRGFDPGLGRNWLPVLTRANSSWRMFQRENISVIVEIGDVKKTARNDEHPW